MNTLSYQDYINYLSHIFNQYDPSKFKSEEELEDYYLLKERLENSKLLPTSVLASPILANVNLDKDTLRVISEIKKTISPYRKPSVSDVLKDLILKINQGYLKKLKTLDLITTSTLLLLVTVLSLLLSVGLVTGEGGTISIPLIGTAGGNEASEMVLNPTPFTFVGLVTSLLAMALLFFEKNKRK